MGFVVTCTAVVGFVVTCTAVVGFVVTGADVVGDDEDHQPKSLNYAY